METVIVEEGVGFLGDDEDAAGEGVDLEEGVVEMLPGHRTTSQRRLRGGERKPTNPSAQTTTAVIKERGRSLERASWGRRVSCRTEVHVNEGSLDNVGIADSPYRLLATGRTMMGSACSFP